jgi:hypothetical protein
VGTPHKLGNLREGRKEGSVEIPLCALSVGVGVVQLRVCTEGALSAAENSCSLLVVGILETQHAYIESAQLGQ